jgi:hypothetical protein
MLSSWCVSTSAFLMRKNPATIYVIEKPPPPHQLADSQGATAAR